MTNDTPRGETTQLAVRPKTLALVTGGGLLAGVLIVVGAIMPAEFNVDPLGLGKLTGVARLWAPDEKTFSGGAVDPAFTSATPRMFHAVSIPLGASDWPEAAVEYKVAMTAGQGFLYRWTVVGADGKPPADPVEVDFHGHTLAADGEAMTVATYRQARSVGDEGSLAAPFDGIHGWYFRNHSPDPVTIRLEVEGYYTLVPPGQPGNEFGIRPLDPAPETLDATGDPS